MQGKSTLGVLLEPAGSVAALRAFDAMVHRIAAARNVTGLENLTNLDQFPPRGATVIARRCRS